jgi:hypothetical protein
MYDEVVSAVLGQELNNLNEGIETLISSKEITKEVKEIQLHDEITMAMRHVAHPSLRETLEYFKADTTKINTKLLNFLDITTRVICVQLIEDVEPNQKKYIDIDIEDELFGETVPNVFDITFPCNSCEDILNIDEEGNCTLVKEKQRLMLTVRFKQNWLYLDTTKYAQEKLFVEKRKGIWTKYSKVIGSAFLAFSNKHGLDVGKLVETYQNNKEDETFLDEPAEELFKHESRANVMEYLKLFYLDGDFTKANKLYEKLTTFGNKTVVDKLLPPTFVAKLQADNLHYDIPADVQDKIKEKEDECEKSQDPKPKRWLDAVRKIPFGVLKRDKTFSFINDFIAEHGPQHKWTKYMDVHKGIDSCGDKKLQKKWKSYLKERREKLDTIKENLDKAVYGHKEVKEEILDLTSQWMNGKMKGTCIGLQGPPGVGKTAIAKNGICKAFVDENGEQFPFVYISLGAANNGSYLFGHHYTFQGSTHGRIADGLMKAKCMNPIFYFDELDKISQTESGKEIVNTLIHLVDFTQNDNYEDMYFSGIKLNLSNCLFIFSFNNASLIDKILLDRLHIIKTHPLNISEKIVIGKDYLLKEICDAYGWNTKDIRLTDKQLTYIIKNYTLEAGVRKYKKSLDKIVGKFNRQITTTKGKKKALPIKVTQKNVDDILDVSNKIRTKMTHKKPRVGFVNGLYCMPEYGLGGTIPLQAKNTIPKGGNKDSSGHTVTVTGNLGKVMSESVECARTAIWELLNEKQRDKLLETGMNIHLHALDGATPKEGPSAGTAITLCMYSLIMNKKIRNNIALTGEINLDGEVGEIGGVPEKVNGGHGVGCNVILLPRENKLDYEVAEKEGAFADPIRVLKDKEWIDDVKGDELCVKFVDTIQDVIKMAFIDDKSDPKESLKKTIKKATKRVSKKEKGV